MERKENAKYLLDRLANGDRLNIVMMSHNAYWPSLQVLTDHYHNLSVQVHGGSTVYLDMFKIEPKDLSDCDLFLLYSSDVLEEDELERMKKIAFEISKSNNKRVTIGYSYFIPEDERIERDISEKVLIYSIKDDSTYEQTDFCTPNWSWDPQDLAGTALKMHNELKGKDILHHQGYQAPNITAETIRSIQKHPSVYTNSPLRTRMGKIYTTEEFEQRSNDILNQPLPGDIKQKKKGKKP